MQNSGVLRTSMPRPRGTHTRLAGIGHELPGPPRRAEPVLQTNTRLLSTVLGLDISLN